LNQLKRREISKKRLIQTVENPEKTIPSFRNRRLRQKTFDDMMLEVVTKTEGSKITVITAYYL